MGKFDICKAWNAFIRWHGWKAFGSACAKLWQIVSGWSGWLPLWASLPAFLAAVAGLMWVFMTGHDNAVAAYALYFLSAYTLAALCCRLPAGIRSVKQWLAAHPQAESLLKNKALHFKIELYLEQLVNFAYGIFKIASGVVIGSAWIGADGIYNLAQALIQLFQILRRKNPGTIQKQWKSYRFCGVLILLMHLTLIGIVFQMVNWNRVEESGEIMIIATAVFAFYKFISSFIDLARDRKHAHPIDSSVRMLEFSQAIFAVFSLQVGLLHIFGTGESWEHWLNLASGCTACLLIMAMGIYMIRRGNRELKKLTGE